MIRKKRYGIVNSLRTIASTANKLFFVFLIAAILLAGWEREACGQTESSPNADALASKETLDDAHKEAVPTAKSAPSQLSGSAQVIPSPEVAEWAERYEKLSNGIQIGQLDLKVADLFYKELNAALTETRNRLRDALTALDAPAPQPAMTSAAKDAESSSKKNTEPENNRVYRHPIKRTKIVNVRF